MKRILGLDLGVASIGAAMVNEAEDDRERSSIVALASRVNPITTTEQNDFKAGKSVTACGDRTLKRMMRRNLQRYKLRRNELIALLRENGWIDEQTLLSEEGNRKTFETYRLRAKAVTEPVSLEEFARILLMINKKRGYKSSRKIRSKDEGQLIDGMEIARRLYEERITPGQFVWQQLSAGKRYVPDFYRSDLRDEFNRIWHFQQKFWPDMLTNDLKEKLQGKNSRDTSAIFIKTYQIYPAENKGKERRMQSYRWRSEALERRLTQEELVFVLSELNGVLAASSNYLGAISDRSKELFFNRQTVGQFLMAQLERDPCKSLKNQPFYRQDYLDEFNTLWEKQAEFHPQLTEALKKEVRDIVIFYQRKLRSQKGSVGICEFERRTKEIEREGKKQQLLIGAKVCPKSSLLFQEFRIWQVLNNLRVTHKASGNGRLLEPEEKEALYMELTLKDKITKTEALKILFGSAKEWDLNYKELQGNRTLAALFQAYQKMIERAGHGFYDFSKMRASEILRITEAVFTAQGYDTKLLEGSRDADKEDFDCQPLCRLWHLLYSDEGDDSTSGNSRLIGKLSEWFGFCREDAALLAETELEPDYGSLSAKAIRKILPYLKAGNTYDVACGYAGYRHSAESLTREEIKNKQLEERLELLPRNSLRNPVVEKILNQMVHVVNTFIDSYGRPDEVRVELARELKKSAFERERMTSAIMQGERDNDRCREVLRREFGLSYVSRNDIIRYKLYRELEPRGFRTLYSDTYIPQEKLFSKEFDVEHIIPQASVMDDTFSNKTLERRDCNIEKGNMTAYDYVSRKYGESGLAHYLERIGELYKTGAISKAKYEKLRKREEDIGEGFLNRDLALTQYISRQAKAMLGRITRRVTVTTGAVTDRLREDWQLMNVLQELNWDRYERLGLTRIIENRDGQRIRRISNWTKRDDHRHHAMDALVIAFTKPSYIQYLNNLHARSDKSGVIGRIEQKELYRDRDRRLRFYPPLPLDEFRREAKEHLERLLVSVKAKNKVVTRHTNITKRKEGKNRKEQLTPRGQLHLESIYGERQRRFVKMVKVGSGFDAEMIAKVAKRIYREALAARLAACGNDPKAAFTGRNNLQKNPVWLDEMHTQAVPEKVDILETEKFFVIRKPVDPDLNLDKVIDPRIRGLLRERLEAYGGDPKRAFANLEGNPIWLNREKGIAVKRVAVKGIDNGTPLHVKRDKEGRIVRDAGGDPVPCDFVNTGNNHHAAIFRDADGKLREHVVSFFEATACAVQHIPIVNRNYNRDKGWRFLFTIKQNEYFVFPNPETGFDPQEIDLKDPENYAAISPNLFRVRKFSKGDYWFTHHLETSVKDYKELRGLTYKPCLSAKSLEGIVKVRLDHIGRIVAVGEEGVCYD